MDIVTYRYFLGCKSYQEVKERYRELVKVHHPDKSTGSHQAFVALQEEYEVLGEGNYYPLRNSIAVNTQRETTYRDGADYFQRNWTARNPKTYEEATQLDPKVLERERAEAFFNSLRATDSTMFNIVDYILEKAKKDKLTKLWIYQELEKEWDLSINHFKYVTFKLGDTVATANLLFRKYQLSKV